MAATAIARSLIFSHFSPSLSLYKRLLHASPTLIPFTITTLPPYRPFSLPSAKTFSSTSETTINPQKRNPKLVNFSLSDSDSDSESEAANLPPPIDKSKLPPPYDPFSKKPAIEEPEDPKNLQEVFHKIRSEGLFNNAVKMFDGLSKDGLTHEALELFAQIKDRGQMPDVVAHTAVVEAYADAGQAKEALKVFLRMLASGVMPNAYTYAVLIKGLARSGDGKMLEAAKKYVVEMMGKGLRPNAGTYVAVFEGFVREGKAEEGREFLVEMEKLGFVAEEKAVREALRDRRGPVVRSVMNLLFDFSSDGSTSNLCSSYRPRLESELRAARLSLLEEIERRKTAENTVSQMCSQCQRLASLVCQTGATIPAPPAAIGMQLGIDSSEQICQELAIARFVAEAIGRGQARAEAEKAAEVIIESKDQEISRLRDRLQYYEAVNREMTQRKQEAMEVARKQQEREKRNQWRWIWGCVGLYVAIGSSLIVYSYLPEMSKHHSLPGSGDSSDASCITTAESA